MPSNPLNTPLHPGIHIRQNVLPRELTITKAAELLGVGRPALSSLLNGNAGLSADMAMRLEKAFEVDASQLLEMQTIYDERQARDSAGDIEVRKYVPPVLQITAQQIASWADSIDARHQLAALLRTLVHSTGSGLTAVDFPAFDNSQRRGWDGTVTAEQATPWIPQGDSGWEFSCNGNPRQKAQTDFQKRTASTSASIRKQMAFVFVTPRNWPQNEAWVARKKVDNQWKDVRVYDANDLEQWLEQSIQAQVRFRGFLGPSEPSLSTLEEVWHEWSDITEPKLPKALFESAVASNQQGIENWLNSSPSKPFVVKADSQLEAIAFLNCAFEQLGGKCRGVYERTVVVRDLAGFRIVANNPISMVVIIASSEVEDRLAGFHRKSHCIIVRRRSTQFREADIELDVLSLAHFHKGLSVTGLSTTRIEQLARESARSPTILRRRLAQAESIKIPPWESNTTIARLLVPLILVGAWDPSRKADREILGFLTKQTDDELENNVSWLMTLPEAPVWSASGMHGIVSKIDALDTVRGQLTKEVLKDFLFAAELVLSNDDPTFDLPKGKRWAADIYEKTRDHSAALRRSICDSLVLLAVHGNNFFGERINIDIESSIGTVVRDLLTPSTKSTWYSQRDELPQYAEAAPSTFLDVVENDLASGDVQLLELFASTGTGIFDECTRSGLLWALELLAWEPDRLVRVVRILAKLCEWKIDDNWSDKPIESLKSVFRFWMPQTSASVDQRNQTLEMLTKQFPTVGWQLCIDQLSRVPSIGHFSRKPRWRTDAMFGRDVVTPGERREVVWKAAGLALTWSAHDEQSLGDLVERFEMLREDHRTRLWEVISTWANSQSTTDSQRATLRERIRLNVRYVEGSTEPFDEADQANIQRLYSQLQPCNLIARHRWLFQSRWVSYSTQECLDANLDYDARDKHISELRRSGLAQIWNQFGVAGIQELCRSCEAPSIVGEYVVKILGEATQREELVTNMLIKRSHDLNGDYEQCVSGFLKKLDLSDRDRLMASLATYYRADEARLLKILCLAPFDSVTWRIVDGQSSTFQTGFWTNIAPSWCGQSASEMVRIVDELIDVERPEAACHIASLKWENLDSSRIINLLMRLARSPKEHEFHFGTSIHDISSAFDVLEERDDILGEELARLEFMFIEALVHTRHGVRNLEAQVARKPDWFVQLLELVYKRTDGGSEPTDLSSMNPEYRSAIATAAYRTLTKLSKIPGAQEQLDSDKEKRLNSWLKNARALALKKGRLKVADKMIGQLLAHSPSDEDGVWPCKPVRDALDEIRSEYVALGIEMGVHNLRGVIEREAGGKQERELEGKYRILAKRVEFEHPFTAKVLMGIADSFRRDAKWWDKQESVHRRLDN